MGKPGVLYVVQGVAENWTRLSDWTTTMKTGNSPAKASWLRRSRGRTGPHTYLTSTWPLSFPDLLELRQNSHVIPRKPLIPHRKGRHVGNCNSESKHNDRNIRSRCHGLPGSQGDRLSQDPERVPGGRWVWVTCWLVKLWLKLKLQYWPPDAKNRLTGKDSWCWERLRAEVGDRGWDGWMASLTPWTWIWANSGRW